MAEVIWTLKALTDLDDIGNFIGKNSEKYAKITIEKLYRSVEFISLNPLIGRILIISNNPTIKEIIKGNYRIIYQICDNKIYILTIHHSARLLNTDNIKNI